jgi:hypothetical protein
MTAPQGPADRPGQQGSFDHVYDVSVGPCDGNLDEQPSPRLRILIIAANSRYCSQSFVVAYVLISFGLAIGLNRRARSCPKCV